MKDAVPPKDFLTILGKNRKAKEFFKTLNRTNRYSIIWRIESARTKEIRKRRINDIVGMLGREEKFR